VPADPSSPIPPALTQLATRLGRADPLTPAEAPYLLAYLATIPDPRAGRGRRHPLVAILALAAVAVLAGARSMTAIAEWAADAPQPVRAALGARRAAPDRWVVPSEATIRRTLGRLDPNQFAAVIGAWLADRDRFGPRPHQRLRAVAVDGKTLRGAASSQPQPLPATRHPRHQPRCCPPLEMSTKATLPMSTCVSSSRASVVAFADALPLPLLR
jgi:hypothetical protein